jgi:Flp pilus assembly protein TadG
MSSVRISGDEPGSARTLSVREQRRQTRRLVQRRKRARQRWERGQTLVIFALTLTVLLGLAGLTIDVARAYDLYARMLRAAEAGALAGVVYQPNHYNTLRNGSIDSAISAASKEVIMNGFGGPTPLAYNANACSGGEVQVCQVLDTDTALEVIITEPLNVVLLSGLGVQPITLVAKGQAEYDPPIGLTSRQSYVGDAMECSSGDSQNTNSYACPIGASVSGGDDHLQYDVAAFDGPAELKEWGDPYVYCAEGPELTTELSPAGPDPNTIVSAYNGFATNHPQWSDVANGAPIGNHCGPPGPNPGNPDQQPSGFEGPITGGGAHPMGYNYIVNVNLTGDNSLWIYNPGFVAQDLSTTPPLTLDHFLDPGVVGPLFPTGGAPPADPGYYAGPNSEGIGTKYDGVHHDAPLFYFTITYSIYQVQNVLDRASDGQLLAQEVFQPYDDTSADLAFHGCTGDQVYNPLWNGADTANWYHNQAGVVAGAPGECVKLQSSDPTGGAGPFGCITQWCAFTDNAVIGCVPPPLPNPNPCTALGQAVDLSNGTYRLVIEAQGLPALAQTGGVTDYNSGLQDGYGQHGYSIKLCAALAATLTSGPVNCSNGTGNGAGGFNVPPLNVTGWNDSTINLIEPLTTQSVNLNFPNSSCVGSNALPYSCHDIACIPSVYAGRLINARIFNSGAVATGDLYIGLVAPPNANATIIYPSDVNPLSKNLDGDTVFQTFDTAHSNYRPYHGLWINIQIQLSSKYKGDCKSTGAHTGKSGWFQLVAIGPAGSVPNDIVTYKFTVVGSPVHLVTPD